MALIQGQAPFYEKYGMTIQKKIRDMNSNSVNGVYQLNFNMNTPCGTTTNFISLTNSVLYIRVPVPKYLNADNWDSSYYSITCPLLDADYFYTENLATGFRIRGEYEKGSKFEIILLPSGNIQITTNIDTSIKVISEGFDATDINSVTRTIIAETSISKGTHTLSIVNSTYILNKNMYDDTVPFSVPKKIIDTVYIKNKNKIQAYNVYGLNAGLDEVSHQKFRIKTPNGIGYIYSEISMSTTSEDLCFKEGNNIYVLKPNTQSITPSIAYEYMKLNLNDENNITKRFISKQYIGSSSYYWLESERITLNTAYPNVKNILVYGCFDRFTNKEKPVISDIYAHVNSSNWFYTSNKSKGIKMQWYASLNSNPNTPYTNYTSLKYFGFDCNSASDMSHYPAPIDEAYIQIETTTVI